MIRLLFVALIVTHGLIHLIGFVREFKLASIDQFSGQTLLPLSATMSKLSGIAWLITTVIWVTTAIIFVFKKEWWWAPGFVALCFSQLLIILYWQDAKFGTIANVIILLVMLTAWGTQRFDQMVKQEVLALYSNVKTDVKTSSTDQISALPSPVQKWLHRSGALKSKQLFSTHLKQRGQMRTKPDGKWMAVEAEQFFTVNSPGFVWAADVKAAPFLYLKGRDLYKNGRGNMLIKAMSLVPVVDSRGPEIDQGSMLRYLAEIIWFPTAALSDYIRWEEKDQNTAIATMRFEGLEASGIFRFNEAGDVSSFEAKRYYDRKGGATLESWLVEMDKSGFRTFEGIRIPAKSSVTWHLESGDFTWFQLEITDLEYNKLPSDFSDF